MDADEIRQKVEPVKCARGHDAVEMYEKNATSNKVRYKCPTCNREIRYGSSIGGKLRQREMKEGDFESEE